MHLFRHLITVFVRFIVVRAMNFSYASIDDLFQGELANLSSQAPPPAAPGEGSQDFGYCCRVAVNESLEVSNGTVRFKPGQTHLVGTFEQFVSRELPCSFDYTPGSAGHKPQVWVSYSWCNDRCPGWTRTRAGIAGTKLWLKPIVLFIIPAMVFSLVIPRRRKLAPLAHPFPRRMPGLTALIAAVLYIPGPAVVLIIDVLIWTFATVAFAGPMLLSAACEAIINRRMLSYLHKKMSNRSLSVRERAHLLLILLFGNLDVEHWQNSVGLVQELPNDDLRRRRSSVRTTRTASTSTGVRNNAMTLQPVLSRSGSTALVPTTSSPSGWIPAEYPAHRQRPIDTVKVQLLNSAESQIGFGSTAGAAAVFYCANFAYTLIELRADYGAAVAAHALAFGTLWTLIPHVAIASSLLLGRNNAFQWDLLLDSLPISGRPPSQSQHVTAVQSPTPFGWRNSGWWMTGSRFFTGRVFRPFFETEIMVAWIWNRSRTKQAWLGEFRRRYTHLSSSVDKDILGRGLESATFVAIWVAIPLTILPAFIGGMISYTTPMVGLGCRSISLLTYACSQCTLILLWTARPTDRDTPAKSKTLSPLTVILRRCAKVAWFAAFSLNVFIGFVTGIISTMLTFASMYSNCLCAVPARWWPNLSSPDAVFFLSQYSEEQILNARLYWIPGGVGSMCLLAAMSFAGWWYSWMIKDQFRTCVLGMDTVDADDVAEHDPDAKSDDEGDTESGTSPSGAALQRQGSV